MQKSESSWRPIAYTSCSMTEMESRYAQIEKEVLVITWACEKFSTYILGVQFEIETDHKLLVLLLGTKYLDGLLPRVLRFCLCLARFESSISRVPEKLYCTPQTPFPEPPSQTLRMTPDCRKKQKLKEEKDSHMVLLTYPTTSFPWCNLSPVGLQMESIFDPLFHFSETNLYQIGRIWKGFDARTVTSKTTVATRFDHFLISQMMTMYGLQLTASQYQKSPSAHSNAR